MTEFEKALPKIQTRNLINLLEGLFTFIKKNAGKLPDESIIDLERKQSKIWKELQRPKRKVKLDDQFMTWLYAKHEKRLF